MQDAAITSDVPQQHPPGLWVLFITEMWERFSYYGMRALLVLYLYEKTGPYLEDGSPNWNPGFGWGKDDASILYGYYTSAVYLTPLVGGWLADRFLGTHRSLLLGGWIIAAGHVMLALTELFDIVPGEPVTAATAPATFACFIGGLVLIVIGTGFFKPCVSVMVGQLYSRDDPRKDSGFTIFYMGINLGAFLAPLVAGTLGQRIGWHWGFGAAAVGMLAGLICYQLFRGKYLRGIGDPPEEKGTPTALVSGLGVVAAGAAVVAAIGVYVLPWVSEHGYQNVFWGCVLTIGLLIMIIFTALQRSEERAPLAVILVLAFIGNVFFWAAFEQAGSSLNFFAEENTDRTLGGLMDDGFPASWYQSVNPLAILLFAPVFSWLWVWLTRRRMNPSTPMKFSLGLYLIGLAFVAMVFGAMQARGDSLAGPHWLLITYTVATWGELCLSPVGLSMVTKLAPDRLQSLMMGVWFLSMAVSNLVAGFVAAYSARLEKGESSFMGYDGLPGFFLMLVVFPIGAGLVLTVLTPWLKRMMHGVH